MKINKYPDGSSYAILERLDANKFNFKINSYEDLWHLNQYVDVYNHNGYKPTVVIPNLIDAQADRRFNKNESSGLKLVCKFLNNINANFKIFHPHNPEVVEALMDNVEIIDNKQFIQTVIFDKISSIKFPKSITNKEYLNWINHNLILMSSDAGGFKPLIKLCNEKLHWKGQTYSAVKSRNPLDGKLEQYIHRDDFEGKDILIINDICVYGGTFKGLSKLLKERNCGKLYLAVSHMTIQNLGEDPVTNYFDKVFTTNSKYDEYYTEKGESVDGRSYHVKKYPKNLEIIKLF